jgi:hypothetical protein
MASNAATVVVRIQQSYLANVPLYLLVKTKKLPFRGGRLPWVISIYLNLIKEQPIFPRSLASSCDGHPLSTSGD